MDILKEDIISTLPKDLIAKAKHMSKTYEYLYCLENLMRNYLDNHPEREKFKISNRIRQTIDSRKSEEAKNKWISVRGNSDLFYLDFKDLSVLITDNYETLKSDFSTQIWITSKLEDLSKYRNLIAHNSYIDTSDFELIAANFNVITRQINIATNNNNSELFNTLIPPSSFITGLNSSMTWTKEQVSNGIQYNLKYPQNLNVAPLFLEAYYNQVDIAFYLVFENSKVHITPSFEVGRETDGEISWFKENILFQVGQYDIDGDGVDEVFICLCDNDDMDNGIQINVFKYYPPALREHSNRYENWELIGDFKVQTILGEPKAFVEKQSITIPRNLRGFFYEWTYSRGLFRDTGNY